MIRAVIFDFDNTLGDRERYAYDMYTEIVERVCPEKTELEKEAILQACMTHDQYGDSNKNYVRDRIYKQFGVYLHEDLNSYWEKNLCRYAVLYDGAKEMLERLKKDYKIAVITNGDAEGQRKKLENSGLIGLLDGYVVSGAIGVRKPERGIFDHMAEELGVKNEECVYVGDVFEYDVCGALNAGMKAVWMWPFGNRHHKVSVPRIEKITDLEELLKTL